MIREDRELRKGVKYEMIQEGKVKQEEIKKHTQTAVYFIPRDRLIVTFSLDHNCFLFFFYTDIGRPAMCLLGFVAEMRIKRNIKN